MKDNTTKFNWNSTFAYTFVGVFFVVLQMIQLNAVEYHVEIGYSSTQILVLLFSVPLLLLFFIFLPILFVIKITLRLNFHTPIEVAFIEVYQVLQSTIVINSKQSSLQVFRC